MNATAITTSLDEVLIAAVEEGEMSKEHASFVRECTVNNCSSGGSIEMDRLIYILCISLETSVGYRPGKDFVVAMPGGDVGAF